MAANRCTGQLDPIWAHAGASHCYFSSPPGCLTSAAAFENSALTSALRASMAPAHASSAAARPFSPSTPSSSTSSASELLSSGHDAAPAPVSSRPGQPPAARAVAGGPRGGRVAKRKPRPSRRPQTTYITADPANFQRMVQEITGLPAPGPSSSSSPAAAVAAPSWTPAAPACVLPTLDTSAFFLLDRAAAAPAPVDRSPGARAWTATHTHAAVAAGADGSDSAALLELEALVRAIEGECGFPALESSGLI